MADDDRTERVRSRVEESLARARARAAPDPSPPPTDPREIDGPDGLDAIPGLARIAASAAWRTSGWALGAYVRTTQRLVEAATSPRQALRLAREVQQGTQELLLGLINATEVGQRVSSGAAPAADVARRAVHDVAGAVTSHPGDAHAHHVSGNGHVSDWTLRDEGEELLRKSRDVRFEVDAHPAYERILSELAPDEGRILRLLLLDGPQAAVDVRTGGPLGLLRSRLIAPGISMIGARAGARYVDRVPSYLNNLFRLGLIWFSRETLRDHMKYQVLEAQPEVLDAIHSVSQAKVVRRSIHLTPFGEDFCRVCLMPEQVIVAELPAHSDPPDDGKMASPPEESVG